MCDAHCLFRFRARYFKLAGPETSRRFLKHCADYIECVSKEAELRERGEVLDIESFTHLRRENSAIRLCFGLFEYVLGIDLPQEVFDDPTFMEAYWAAADLVCWANVGHDLPFFYMCLLTLSTGRLFLQRGTGQGS